MQHRTIRKRHKKTRWGFLVVRIAPSRMEGALCVGLAGGLFGQKLGRLFSCALGRCTFSSLLACHRPARQVYLTSFVFVAFVRTIMIIAVMPLTPPDSSSSLVRASLRKYGPRHQHLTEKTLTNSLASVPVRLRHSRSSWFAGCRRFPGGHIGLAPIPNLHPPATPSDSPSCTVLRGRRCRTFGCCSPAPGTYVCHVDFPPAFVSYVDSRSCCHVLGPCRRQHSFLPATAACPPLYTGSTVKSIIPQSLPVRCRRSVILCTGVQGSAEVRTTVFASSKDTSQRRKHVAVQGATSNNMESEGPAGAQRAPSRNSTTRDTDKFLSSKEAHSGFSFSFPKTGGYVSSNDLRTGSCVVVGDQAFRVLQFQSVKMARAAAYVRARLKNLVTGATIDHNFRSDEKLRVPEITVAEATFTGFRPGAPRASHGARKVGGKHQETTVAAALRAVGLEHMEGKRDTVLVFTVSTKKSMPSSRECACDRERGVIER